MPDTKDLDDEYNITFATSYTVESIEDEFPSDPVDISEPIDKTKSAKENTTADPPSALDNFSLAPVVSLNHVQNTLTKYSSPSIPQSSSASTIDISNFDASCMRINAHSFDILSDDAISEISDDERLYISAKDSSDTINLSDDAAREKVKIPAATAADPHAQVKESFTNANPSPDPAPDCDPELGENFPDPVNVSSPSPTFTKYFTADNAFNNGVTPIAKDIFDIPDLTDHEHKSDSAPVETNLTATEHPDPISAFDIVLDKNSIAEKSSKRLSEDPPAPILYSDPARERLVSIPFSQVKNSNPSPDPTSTKESPLSIITTEKTKEKINVSSFENDTVKGFLEKKSTDEVAFAKVVESTTAIAEPEKFPPAATSTNDSYSDNLTTIEKQMNIPPSKNSPIAATAASTAHELPVKPIFRN
mmetsp:Transcript_50110/g.98088  ORF Transcript_50110/g.98088 Transcript_50110/m.98088 type:complete len:419 (-) Transcript_50110:810-2066(-)